MSIYKHKHHIIPKHAGGSDDPSNIIELTVEEHAEAHRKLYEEHGRWQDRVAWLALSGRIGKDEIIQMKQSEGGKRNKGMVHTEETRRKVSESLTGKPKSEESRRKQSESRKGMVFSEEHKRNLSESLKGRDTWNKGKTGIYSEETRRKMSESAKKRKPMSEETKRKLSEAAKKHWANKKKS